MILELIATIFAALGAAGIALGLRVFFRKLPKWVTPASAGLGMLLFQIYSEYTWLGHTKSLLPPQTVVVAEIPETAFYKPWSYIKPPVLKLVAVDQRESKKVDGQPNIRQANLYFFERRMSAKAWPIRINCQTRMQADNPQNMQKAETAKWHRTPYTENIAKAICLND